MNKNLGIALAVVAVLVVIGGGSLLLSQNSQAPVVATEPSSPVSPPIMPVTPPSAPSPVTTPPTQPTPSPLPTAAPKTVTVTYSSSGYSPAAIEIDLGDTVTFLNTSSGAMWPASAKHPTHSVYPTTGGCLGSTFDACAGVQSGGSWSFKFDIVGAWAYHDHLNSSKYGKITVK